LIDFDINNFNYNYNFILLNNNYLESTNSIYTTFKWLKYIFIYKPDVINLTGYSEPGTLFVLLITKILNINTIITNESVYQKHAADFDLLFYIKKKYKNILFSLTDYFFSYGINSNDFLFRHKVHKSKILSFSNSFDSQRLKGLSNIHNKKDNQYFLFVGRISFEKNIDFLVQLAIKLKEANSDILIKIIGSGPELDRLSSEIRILNLNNILFVGSIKWENLGGYYSKSLGLILPSFFEPWGMVANEAFFYNTPVICSRFCGCAGDLVINNFNGLVLEDYSLAHPNNDLTFFIDHFLLLRDKFVDNIKLTNRIFEPERLSNDLYQSFKNIV
jgi:glycosyltransferase involved in cell wall biosynthesis